jgi:exosortase family protein XrtF
MKAYRPAIFFILRYLGLYLALNTVYAFYVDHYRPRADPFTIMVSGHTVALLTLLKEPVSIQIPERDMNVPILRDEQGVVAVYEGCNGINVMIVYLCFLIAFRGPWRSLLKFSLLGICILYIINLLRVAGLYGVSLHYPDQMYFFHKFFFTGTLYGLVFVMWFFWIKTVKAWNLAQQS